MVPHVLLYDTRLTEIPILISGCFLDVFPARVTWNTRVREDCSRSSQIEKVEVKRRGKCITNNPTMVR